ncbi:uncharacterized protein SEPMUDRAFT_135574 [Sphaerulina musiva SO2202]|uniref:Uncharacterized protein n=1 Tax=Sphaerulina musiva (strain SO2202) TaxID=692275 RepID=M3BU89_SPHMS|nr:uncharacterized protein SEPMUDRAFT_135574 [Sphaerulina musiva SO2202]EMF10245.1 hypothetical protein SEPMUDRAFT_135574 [Sphaerulina musiva SO2202]
MAQRIFRVGGGLPPIAQFDCHTAKTARLQYNGYRTLSCIDHRASSPPPQTQQLLVSGLTLAAKSTSSSNLDRTELRIPLHDSAGSASTDNGTIRRNLNCEELLNSCRRVWWRHVTRPPTSHRAEGMTYKWNHEKSRDGIVFVGSERLAGGEC